MFEIGPNLAAEKWWLVEAQKLRLARSPAKLREGVELVAAEG